MMHLLETRVGKIIMSILIGLGLSALFRRACKGRNCIVRKAPNPADIKGKVFKFDDKCFTYDHESTKCDSNPVE